MENQEHSEYKITRLDDIYETDEWVREGTTEIPVTLKSFYSASIVVGDESTGGFPIIGDTLFEKLYEYGDMKIVSIYLDHKFGLD